MNQIFIKARVSLDYSIIHFIIICLDETKISNNQKKKGKMIKKNFLIYERKKTTITNIYLL